MNFINVDNADSSKYLEYSSLEENTQVFRIGYVVDISNGVSRLDTPYYTLFIKTIDGVVLPCTIFNITDFLSQGFQLNLLKNKYIKLNCRVQEYKGRLGLIFIGCEEVNPTPELVEKFTNKIDGIDDYFNEINGVFTKAIDKSVPDIWKITSFNQIYNGSSGGYIKFCWDILLHCQVTTMDMDYIEFIEILYSCFVSYYNYLTQCNKINLISDSDKIQMVSELPNSNYKERLIRDTFSAIIGLSKPNHLNAVIIASTFDYVQSLCALKRTWSNLRPGGVCECEGYQLVRY